MFKNVHLNCKNLDLSCTASSRTKQKNSFMNDKKALLTNFHLNAQNLGFYQHIEPHNISDR